MEILGSRALDEVFDDYIDRWHADPMQFSSGGVTPEDLAKCLAHSNFLLWHEEDKARRRM